MDIDSGTLVLALLAVAAAAVWLGSTSSQRHKKRSHKEREKYKQHIPHKRRKPSSTTGNASAGTAPLGHAGGGSGGSSIEVPPVPITVGSTGGLGSAASPGIRIQSLAWVSKATGQTKQVTWPDTEAEDPSQPLLSGLQAGDTLTFQGTGIILDPTGNTFLTVQSISSTNPGSAIYPTSPGTADSATGLSTVTYTFPSNIPSGYYFLFLTAYQYSGGQAIVSSDQFGFVS